MRHLKKFNESNQSLYSPIDFTEYTDLSSNMVKWNEDDLMKIKSIPILKAFRFGQYPPIAELYYQRKGPVFFNGYIRGIQVKIDIYKIDDYWYLCHINIDLDNLNESKYYKCDDIDGLRKAITDSMYFVGNDMYSESIKTSSFIKLFESFRRSIEELNPVDVENYIYEWVDDGDIQLEECRIVDATIDYIGKSISFFDRRGHGYRLFDSGPFEESDKKTIRLDIKLFQPKFRIRGNLDTRGYIRDTSESMFKRIYKTYDVNIFCYIHKQSQYDDILGEYSIFIQAASNQKIV